MAFNGLDAWRRDRPSAVAFDTETTGLTWFDKAFCVTIAWEGESHYFDLEVSWSHVEEILNGSRLICHHAKFDIQKALMLGLLHRDDLTAEGFEDTQIASHLLDEHRPKALKHLAEVVLGETTDEDAALAKVRREMKLTKDDGYDKLPREVIVPYALKDAEFTYRLWKVFSEQLSSDLLSLYAMEKQLVLTMMDVEAAGMGVDVMFVDHQIKEHNTLRLREELNIEKLCGKKVGDQKIKVKVPRTDEDGKPVLGKKGQQLYKSVPQQHPDFLNPNAPGQLITAFAERGILLEDTKDETLQKVDDPLAQSLTRYRQLAKLVSTYLSPMREEQRDGVLHPNFRLTGTVTGRMASGEERGD
jgi:DNA polymerase I-like protein with 3'-5' exonuclease and polymerase domains